MFESVVDAGRKSISHVDSGIKFSMDYPLYTAILTAFYTLFLYFAISSYSPYLLAGLFCLIFVFKAIIFGMIAVQYYGSSIENKSLYPHHRIKNWSDIFITGSLVGGIILLGLLLFVVPGMYFGYRFSQAIPIVAIHKESPIDGLKQSWTKTRGNLIQLVTISGLTLSVYSFISIGILSSYLLLLEFNIIGAIVALLFIGHSAFFEVGLFGGLTSLYLNK